MDKDEFCYYRRKLGKTQREWADILGMSLKTVHSYEQGLRSIPPHIARYLYFLVVNQSHESKTPISCWEAKRCMKKESCPVWEFNCGHICWFVCGTRCEGREEGSKNKLEACKTCVIFKNLFEEH